ncbi:MAG: hypothetical protein QM817_40140 [Archangium sp.]
MHWKHEDSAIAVSDSTPLWVLDDILKHSSHQYALVLTETGHVLGMLRREVVTRFAERLPEVPVRLLPVEKVFRFSPDSEAAEFQRAMSDEEVVAFAEQHAREWKITLRENLKRDRN